MIDNFDFMRTVAVDPTSDSIVQQSDTAELPSNLAWASEIERIKAIEDRQKNILIYFWEASLSLKDRIAATPYEELPDFIEKMSLQVVLDFMKKDQGLLLNQLFQELLPIVETFLGLCGSKHFQFRLGRLQDAMCPLFHVDNLNLRMITTLRGPGTEWLGNDSVRRNGLGKGSNRKIVKPSATVHQLKTFQIGFLKGEKFPGAFGKGLVHRSPAIPHSLDGRWFFRLDGLS